MPRGRTRRDRTTERSMTYADERVAAEMGRVLLALYRAGMQVRVWPDALHGRAGARIVAGPSAKRRRTALKSASGSGDSPLQAIYAAVERMNERAGAIVVPLD
ncbi:MULTISPECIES: hypothetical protein [Anaeromyxobacter]|uniref:Uncharacterized protein n=1 Tax=Anaeromyxobacter dehalogenans (strain ATCC BAA-258 / DSM 21875 / 2CP-1) TaxID=455488 RepID=B8J8I1_ANAD2|nr:MULTISPECIES: hypothetical protein [Anaeromyxobacter]ACG75069.1 conserved hypothetical protein [Anaeromyxobacter sp. K]ACL67267.1 conserved hypothetical protein [Anaeromyxobacter dehalogenans 2CP-1]GAO05519.1 hypothetical protein PSR1_04433 [Anaeromyxobacter sp. PSR-1]